MKPCCRVLSVVLAVCGCSMSAATQPVDIETGLPPRARVAEPWRLPPPPSDEKQREAEVEIKRVLQGRIDLDSPDSAALCRSLRDLARGTVDDPAACYVLLRMSYDRALRSGDSDLAREVIDDIARSFRIDSLKLRGELLAACVEAVADDPDRAAEEARRAFRLIEESLVADRVDLADRVLALAKQAASPSGDFALETKVARWVEIVVEWSQSVREAERAAMRLVQEPRDAQARLAVGRYLCFTKGQWSLGLPHLAGGGDEALAALAQADLRAGDDHAHLAVADQWRDLAAKHRGLARRRILLHADEIDRRVYPSVTGLTRLKIEERMLSRPLFVFDAGDPPSADWIEEHLRFRGGHGREGSGSWAHLALHEGRATLVANRAGFVETLEHFPPAGVEHYEIEAELWSDLLKGTVFEFGGTRLYFGDGEGPHLEGGWVPNVIYPIPSHRFHHYLIDVSPEGISFTLNGVYLGTMPMERLAHSGLTLRGWEGHVQCRRLVVWALPDADLTLAIHMPQVEASAPWTHEGVEFYPGFAADLRTMRQTQRGIDGGSSPWSTGEAIAAAQRIFAHFPEVGVSRRRVLEVLGEPNRIGIHGVETGDDRDAPLVYCFDTGFGGIQFTIHFENDRVSRIEPQPLE